MMKKHFLLIFISEILLFVIAAAFFTASPLKSYHFTYDQLQGTAGKKSDDNEVFYINDTMTLSGTFGNTPQVTLTPGTYTISVNYDTKEEGHYLQVVDQYTVEGAVLGNYDVELSPALHDAELDIWVTKHIPDFVAKAGFSGSGALSVHSIHIAETPEGRRLLFSGLILLFLIADLLLCPGIRNRIKSNKNTILLIAVITLFASYPLLNDYLFESSDMKFHLRRIDGIKEALLTDHQFPVRMLSNCMSGYGYPVSIFYADFFLYFPALLCMLGMPLQTAFKIYIICFHGFTAALSFYCFGKIFKNRLVGAAGAFLYTLAPYRISTLYMRAALGEFTAMTFLPLILYGLWIIYTSDTSEKSYKNKWLPLTLGLSGIIQCHILSCEITAILIIIACILLWKHTFRRPRFILLCKTVLGTLFLNAWFLVPFLTYMFTGKYYINNPEAAYLPKGSVQASGLTGTQIFSLFPYYRTDAEGIADNAGFLILGAAFLLVLIAFFTLLFYKGNIFPEQKKACFVFGFFTLLSIWFGSCYFPYSSLQKLHPAFDMLIGNLQFPYRFLTAISLFVVFLFCIVLYFLLSENKNIGYGFCCIILLAALLEHGHMIESFIASSPRFHAWNAESAEAPRMGRNDYLPMNTNWEELSAEDAQPVCSPDMTLSYFEKIGTTSTLTFDCTKGNGYLEIPSLYYTGYTAEVSDYTGNVSLVPGSNHKIGIVFETPGSGSLTVRFTEPWYWRMAEVISLLTLLTVIACIIVTKRGISLKSAPFGIRQKSAADMEE